MLKIPPLLHLDFSYEHSASPEDSDEDKYPESLPRSFIEQLTKPNAKVFDPFMGHGTTAFVAEALGRIPYGIEADRARYEWCAGQLENWHNMHHADAADMAALGFPKMDFCITSPPYMPRHHKWNPLYGGDPAYAGYDRYLERLSDIFAALKQVMKRNATIIVQADNLTHGRIYTPLVRDMSIVVSEHFTPIGETLVLWTNRNKTDAPYTHCLGFKNTK